MSTDTYNEDQKIGIFHYIIGLFSFIPVVGVPLGIICAVYGLFTKRKGGKILMTMGICGVLITVSIFGYLRYTLEEMSVHPDLAEGFVEMSQRSLNQAIPALEYYKIQNDKYPESLADLKGPQIVLTDFSSMKSIKDDHKLFYYSTVEGGYVLLGRGPDGVAGTEDDILPIVENRGKIGLKFSNEVKGHDFVEEVVAKKSNESAKLRPVQFKLIEN